MSHISRSSLWSDRDDDRSFDLFVRKHPATRKIVIKNHEKNNFQKSSVGCVFEQ
jgi:hypothetical protein